MCPNRWATISEIAGNRSDAWSTGEQAIEIRFSGELTQALEEQKLTLGVYLGMLTRTLMGVVPGVDGVHVLIDGAAVTALDAEKTPDGEALAFKNELMQSDDFLSWTSARRSSSTTGRSRAAS